MKTIQYYKLKNTNNIYQSFSLAKGAIHYIAQEYKGMRPLGSENEDQLSKGSTKECQIFSSAFHTGKWGITHIHISTK